MLNGTLAPDEIVSLAGRARDPWTAASHLDGAVNIRVQDICPGRPVTHAGLLSDAVVAAVVRDALNHPGPADPARIDRAICNRGAHVDALEVADRTATIYANFPTRPANARKVDAKPSLAASPGAGQ